MVVAMELQMENKLGADWVVWSEIESVAKMVIQQVE
jgi:hypothetical protein